MVPPPATWGPPLTDPGFTDSEHGFYVASYAVGDTVGVAANAKVAFVRGGIHENNVPFERFVEAFLAVADDKEAGDDKGVVNMSFGIPPTTADQNQMAWIWCKLLFLHASLMLEESVFLNQQLTLTGDVGEVMKKMEDDLGIVFVLAGNYQGRSGAAFPDRCMPYLYGGILTGAADRKGIAMDLTPGAEDPDVFAPGVDLPYPEGDTVHQTGTSYGEPEAILYRSLVTTLTCLPLF